MDMTTLATAQASIKAVFSLAKAATSAAVDHELKARLIEIQSCILEVQERLGDAQADRSDLVEEVAELKQRIRDFEEKRTALMAYSLFEVFPGKFLYKFQSGETAAVEHFACPTCYNAGQVTVLQSAKTGAEQIKYACQTCKFHLWAGHSDPIPPQVLSVSKFRGDW